LSVVVLGLMGAGKSSLGRALAARWSRSLSDSDTHIEHAHGRSAAEIAQAEGVGALHDLEAAHLLTALATRPSHVVSAAASVVDRSDCLSALGGEFVVWLDLRPDVLARRFATGAHRPRYGPDSRVVLAEQRERRAEAFAAVADLTIRDDTLPISLLAEEVEHRIRHQEARLGRRPHLGTLESPHRPQRL
jgi:shikimate kinase